MNHVETPYRFEIDFSSMPDIPEDPKARLPYFDSFKALLQKEREKIKRWHRAGAGGREVIQAHTGLIDQAIGQTVASLARLPRYAGAETMKPFGLAAVGGYGRGELNPCSDIDLLFILGKKIQPLTDDFIQDFISVLWGLGLEIGHSCRSVKECLELAKTDLTVQTSMIEMRYLAGNPALFEELGRALGKNALKKNIEKFLSVKLGENRARSGSTSEWVCRPEPDIKNGPGGLRDYHTVLWGVASQLGSLSLLEMGDNPAISEDELKSFNRSVDFFLRVRNELHYSLGKKSDVLRLGIQSGLAVNLGYQNINETDRVEQFMRDYFLHAKNIYNFSEIIFQRCLQTRRPYIRKVISNLNKKDLGNGFFALKSVLHLKDSAPEIFTNNKRLLLELFDLCRRHGLEIDSQLKRQIRNHRHLLDDAFLKEHRAGDFLMSLLDNPDAEKTLRLMHAVGILGKILPEFGHTHCLVKYDFYHRYTADEHSLRMVRFLEHLAVTEENDLRELAEIHKTNPHKRLLKLAALLHSLGKDPSRLAQDMDGAASSSIIDGLPAEEKQILLFLLDNLYEMTEIAFYQEIQHLSTIQAFAAKVGTVERLELLYLITYAELKAVAPDTWTSWKKFLLSELYHFTKDYLEHPELLHKKRFSTRLAVYRKLHADFFAWEIEQHLDLMPDDYWLTAPPDEVAQHLRLLRVVGENRFALSSLFNEAGAYHNVTLCYMKNDRTFKSMVGAITANNLNILGAQIFLRRDDATIVTLQVEGANREDGSSEAIWLQVEKNLQDILENRREISELLAARKRYVGKNAPRKAVVPKIQIDNSSNPAYTVIRVEARDHLGMLYKIVHALVDFGVQIHRAKISCRGDRGIDVFYVSLRGGKITFDRLTRQIKERLIGILLIENVEDVV
ncbi:MAG: [protein-PII] uridylyltransferase [Nitrospinales bacterium]